MPKQKITLLLIGLMCFSSISGFFTVICHGSDGHVAVEPVVHNHCECSESGENGHRDRPAGTAIESSGDHDHEHCTDTIAASNYIVSARKNLKLSAQKVFMAILSPKSVSTHTLSVFGHPVVQSHESFSFFAPLRTIILLA